MTAIRRFRSEAIAIGVLAALALAGALLVALRPVPPDASEASRPGASSRSGDPFVATGSDTSAAPRVLLPAVHSVADAVETGEGWIVLDSRNDRIHALDRAGRLRWSAGGTGEGPGELLRPVALTVADTTVVVADARGRSLDRFDLQGRFLGRTALRATDCMGNLVRGVSPWPDGTVILMRLCLDPGVGTLHMRADRIGPDGGATTLSSLPLKNLRRPGDDLLADGVLVTRDTDLYMGVTSSRCVRVRPSGAASGAVVGGAPDSLCLPGSGAVPLPDEEREKLKRVLGRRPLARALGLHPPTTLPPFDRVFPAERGVVFRAITSVEDRELVWVGPDGRSRRLPVPANEHTFVGARSILVSWQEPEGTALRIVALPEPPGRRPATP